MRGVDWILRLGRLLRRVFRALRPRGTPAATAAAWFAFLAATAFLAGAVVTQVTAQFFQFGAVEWEGLTSGAETARVVRALASVFAIIQVGLGLAYAYFGVQGWRGRTESLEALGRGDSAGYALTMMALIFGGFALNFIGVLLAIAFFWQVVQTWDALTEKSSRAPVDVALAVIRRRHRVEPVRAADGDAVVSLVGQDLCHQCGMPNPSGRKRCRVCASHLFDIPVPEVRLIPPAEATGTEPLPVPLPRRRRRKRQMADM